MKRLLANIVATCLCVFLFTTYVSAISFDDIPEITSEIAFVACKDNDQVVFEKNADLPVSPAGLLGVCVAMVVIESNPDLDRLVTVPSDVDDFVRGTDAATLNLDAGDRLSVRDLLTFSIIRSAADVSYTLAMNTCSTVDEFVSKMNDYAQKCGCTNTVFKNITGLDTDGQYTTARDMWKIAKAASLNFDFISVASLTYHEVEETEHNAYYYADTTLLMRKSGYGNYYSSYIIWGKTGNTSQAGRCVTVEATHDGYTYIYVVMKGDFDYPEGVTSMKRDYSFYDCKQLLSWSFNSVKLQTLCDTNTLIATIPLKNSSKTDHLAVYPAQQIRMLLPSSVSKDAVIIEIDENLTKDTLYAPIGAGEVVGRANIYYAKEVIASVDLVTAQAVMFSPGAAIKSVFLKILPYIVILFILIIVYVLLHIFSGFTLSLKSPRISFNQNIRRRNMNNLARMFGADNHSRTYKKPPKRPTQQPQRPPQNKNKKPPKTDDKDDFTMSFYDEPSKKKGDDYNFDLFT